MPRPSVLITRRLPIEVERRLRCDYDATPSIGDIQLTPDELRDALCSFDIVLCTLTDRLTRDVLSVSGRRARLLANFGVGFDHIDLDAARDAGIVVTNTPGVLTDDTADLAMLLILAVARRTSQGERELRRGAWEGWTPTHMLGRRVHGASLGIIGLGRIGTAVAQRAHAGFGMTVRFLAHPGRASRGHPAYAEPVAVLDELLERSDFVTLHCPASAATHHLINANALAHMTSTSYLINTARGPIVDSAALAAALERGAIAGAGLDVYEGEPRVHPDLLSAPNVTLLPHLGSATQESRTAMGMIAADNIDAFVRGEGPPNRLV